MKSKVIILIVIDSSIAFASRPLKSDDAFTLGRNLFQLELAYEIIPETGFSLPVSSAYGIWENTDILINVSFNNSSNGSIMAFECIDLEAKKYLTSILGFEIATKFGFSSVIEKGFVSSPLGSLILISSLNINSFNFHFNCGYANNKNEGEFSDLWFGSVACEYFLNDQITIGTDLGIGRNPSFYFSSPTGYALLGVSYKLLDSVSIDTGLNITFNEQSKFDMFTSGLTIVL